MSRKLLSTNVPGLSVSLAEYNRGLLWIAAQQTPDNPNIWGVSTTWDPGTLTQDEVKGFLDIHEDTQELIPDYYVASSSVRGVMVIANRLAVGDYDFKQERARVLPGNILNLNKQTFWHACSITDPFGDILHLDSRRMPLVVANGSLMLHGNDLYYSPDPYASDASEFKFVAKYYRPSGYSDADALASNLCIKTPHKG